MRSPPLEHLHKKRTPVHSRRDILATLGGASLIGVSGCITSTGGSSNQPRYQLSTRSLGPTLTRKFTWEPDGPFESLDQEFLSEIIARGPVTADGVRLSNLGADNLSYVKQDETYYKISATELDTVTRKKWLFWFDKVDSKPPADAEIYSSSLGLGEQTPLDTTYGLSELDIHVVETAEGQMAPEHGFIDLEEDRSLRLRGYLFLRRSPDETDLVLEPPFTHVAFESGNGTVYARAVVERISVELTQFKYTATPVGETAEAFNDILRQEYLTTTFSDEELSSEQQSLLSETWVGQGYEETTPLSNSYTSILKQLEVLDTEQPEPRMVEFSDEIYFEYEGTYYEAQLEIFG